MNETFISHLIELRSRLIRAVVAVLVVFVCLYPFDNKLYRFLANPLLSKLPKGAQMIATDVATPFFVPLKVALLAAIIIALPYLLYQVWAFVAPGLYQHEKRLVGPLIVASTALFICGMAFAYYAVLPVVFGFLTGTAPANVAVMTDISKYLDFITRLFLAFGVVFEVPVVVVVLVRAGVVSIQQLVSVRRYVIVGSFVFGAIFAPPDVLSQTMMAIPLWLLYEVGIVAARLFVRHTRPALEHLSE